MLGILPGVIGTIQATETVKLLLGKGTSLSGRLLLYDALNMRFRELKLRKDPNAKPITELIDYDQFCGVPGVQHVEEVPEDEPFERITPIQLEIRLDGGWAPYVLDVRKPHEAEIVAFPFMDRLQPHEDVLAIADELPRDRDVLVTCKSGGRSAKACRALAGAGFTRLTNLDGGITGWAKDVDPSLPTY